MLLVVLGILAPVLGIWAGALDRRGERKAIAVDQQPARRQADRQ